MCHSSNIILSEENELQVSWCKSCEKFAIIHKSTCASFSTKELSQFVNKLRNLGADAYSYLTLGEPRVVLLSIHSKTELCLTKSEVSVLMRLIREARNLFEAFRPIYG